MKICHSTMCLDSCGRGPIVSRLRLGAWSWLLLALCGALTTPPAAADGQTDPELRSVVQEAIGAAQCFNDEYDSQVWFKMMEPRLRRKVKRPDERVEILQSVFCEAHRSGAQRLPPGLVLAIIDVESSFNRYAVSSAGAVGLMQVMPFWPEELGMRRFQLITVSENIKMGAAIFRHYLKRERNNVAKALARYNGSVGRRVYSDLVINRWTRWNGADDLGRVGDLPKLTW
jgi:soluble lytic murein transglycosylase-like protein